MNRDLALTQFARADAEAAKMKFEDVLRNGLRANIPPEILTRLKDIWRVTRRSGEQVVRIGRIVVLKIIEFVKAHPHLAVGAALAAITAFLLTSAIPWIGPVLAPFAAALAAIYGAGAAASRRGGGGISPSAAAKSFAEAFVDMMLAVSDGIANDVEGAGQ